jgi:hypothetical protein
MIQAPKAPWDKEACFYCGQKADKRPGYAAMCEACAKADSGALPRNLEILETIAKIATQCPSLRIGQILGNMTTSHKDLFYVDDSNLHNRLKKFLKANA